MDGEVDRDGVRGGYGLVCLPTFCFQSSPELLKCWRTVPRVHIKVPTVPCRAVPSELAGRCQFRTTMTEEDYFQSRARLLSHRRNCEKVRKHPPPPALHFNADKFVRVRGFYREDNTLSHTHRHTLTRSRTVSSHS